MFIMVPVCVTNTLAKKILIFVTCIMWCFCQIQARVAFTGTKDISSMFGKKYQRQMEDTKKNISKELCGGDLVEESGILQALRYSNNPESSKECIWKITVPENHQVLLKILNFEVEDERNCSLHRLDIRDGHDSMSPMLGSSCGEKFPDDIRSSNNTMLVKLFTDRTIENEQAKFVAVFEKIEVSSTYQTLSEETTFISDGNCGGISEKATGSVISPLYPEEYPSNTTCIWEIISPPEYRITLNFRHFDVEDGDDCMYDSISIISIIGENEIRKHGHFCGSQLPRALTSESNILRIEFNSDYNNQKSGFVADFHAFTCGGVIEGVNGTLTSPLFPESYPPNTKCIWEIIAPMHHHIILNFTHFDLDNSCINLVQCDRVSVVDKLSDNALLNQRNFSGILTPFLIISKENKLIIEFTTDMSVQKSGFAAVFFIEKDECAVDNGGCEHICKNTIGSYVCKCENGFILHENLHDCKEVCFQEIKSPLGEITSPNYPNSYLARADCAWLLTVTPGHRIKLTFDFFELEFSDDCTYDKIVLYDGVSDFSNYWKFCGSQIPEPVLFSANQMYMIFTSDSTDVKRGFKITHTTVCGGLLGASEDVQHLYSHFNYGKQNYGDKVDCSWIIQSQNGGQVRLRFLTFDLEYQVNCDYDYVEIIDGYTNSDRTLGKYCGNKVLENVYLDFRSSSGSLLIHFHSDPATTGAGFHLVYSTREITYQETLENPGIL